MSPSACPVDGAPHELSLYTLRATRSYRARVPGTTIMRTDQPQSETFGRLLQRYRMAIGLAQANWPTTRG